MEQPVYKFEKRLWLCYAGIALSIPLLFFRNDLTKPPFCIFNGFMCLHEIFPGITVGKMLLFIINISLFNIILLPLPIEDERVERMRNYAFKYTLRVAVLGAISVGFFLTTKLNLMVYAVIIQCYYIVLFRLFLYRDSKIVYMTDEELKNNDDKVGKRFRTFFYINNVLAIIVATILSKQLNNPEVFWIVTLINIGIVAFVQTIYFGWRS